MLLHYLWMVPRPKFWQESPLISTAILRSKTQLAFGDSLSEDVVNAQPSLLLALRIHCKPHPLCPLFPARQLLNRQRRQSSLLPMILTLYLVSLRLVLLFYQPYNHLLFIIPIQYTTTLLTIIIIPLISTL